MPKIALSDVGLRSLQAPERGTIDYWDKALPAFGLRVSQGGAKTFILKLHNSRRAIGRFPILSLSEARTEARRLLAEKTLGKVRPQSITFRTALTLFLDEKRKSRRPRTAHNLEARLNRHFSFQGQLTDFTHQEVARRLRRIKSTAEHDHALSVAKTFFTWCHNRRYIDDNPTRGLSPHGHTSRSRVLTDDEIRLIWQATGDATHTFSTIVRLLLLTGARRGEIAALRKEWINFGTDLDTRQATSGGSTTSATKKPDLCTITIPATVTKNGREHTFPIGSFAFSVISTNTTARCGDTPPTKQLFFAARGKDTPFNGWSKAKKALDKECGVKDWTLHDLRRTFATRMAALGCPIHILERAFLNHVSGQISGVAAVYNRHSYLEEARLWAEKWDDFLISIVEPTA